MSKCNKVKNPCKICLGPVSHKNGLQCHGACASWVHYSCLQYTPGKIKDIKAGIIKVTCPCPDCKTSMPKEYRTDQPYSCTNSQCPANRPPKCENNNCPINDPRISAGTVPPGYAIPGQGSCKPPPCPLSKCGTECKQYSSPQLPNVPPQPSGPPCVPARRGNSGMGGEMGGGGCGGGGGGGYGGSGGFGSMSPVTSSDTCHTDITGCPSGCSSTNDVPGDFGMNNMSGSVPSFHVVEQMCNTVGQLTNQINDLMCKMKQACKEKDKISAGAGSCGGGGHAGGGHAGGGGCGGGGGGGRGGGGGGCCKPPPPPPPPSCGHPASGGGTDGTCKVASCQQPKPKPKTSTCPKPCFCPGNQGQNE